MQWEIINLLRSLGDNEFNPRKYTFWLLRYTSLNTSRSFCWSTGERYSKRVPTTGEGPQSTGPLGCARYTSSNGSYHLYSGHFCRMQSVAISNITWVSEGLKSMKRDIYNAVISTESCPFDGQICDLLLLVVPSAK